MTGGRLPVEAVTQTVLVVNNDTYSKALLPISRA